MAEGFKSGRGGKRKGAGRPATGRTTKVVRVSKNMPNIDDLITTIELLREWKILSESASPTSPRWQRLRELLESLPSSIFEDKTSL